MVTFLIIRFSSIGDIVLTTPLIRCLKKQVEGACIHYLTKKQYAPLLTANPYIDKIHVLEKSLSQVIRQAAQENIDYIIDLHRNIRSTLVRFRLRRMSFQVDKLNLQKWLLVNLRINLLPDRHIVDRYLDTTRLFGVRNDGKGLDYFIPEADEVSLSDLHPALSQGYVALVAGAGHATKQLPPDKLKAVCALIDKPVLLLGGPGDKQLGEFLAGCLPGRIFNGCGRFNINQSASLVRQSTLVITPDTGLMHIAAAFNKKIISIWGNTIPEFGMSPYQPDPESVMFERKGLKCRPCSKIGFKECPKKHFRCMNDLDEREIAAKASSLFES